MNIVDHLGNTALMHACRSNHTDVVELLLQNGADINIVDKAGCHVLLESSGRGFTDIIHLLLTLPIQTNVNINHTDRRIHTPLMVACLYCHIDIVVYLISRGADTKLVNDYGVTAFEMIGINTNPQITKNDINTFKLKCQEALLKYNGMSINIELKKNKCVVCHAPAISKCGKCSLVYYCCREHQKTNWKNHKLSCVVTNKVITIQNKLRCAISSSDISIVTHILDKNPEYVHVSTGIGEKYVSHLMRAASSTPQMVKLLIKRGADVNDGTNSNGFTPLMMASQYGYIDSLLVFIKSGALLNIQDQYGCSALEYACQGGRVQCVRLLIKAGASVNMVNNTYGSTCLIVAAENGHTDIVQLLIDSGAELEIADKLTGITPLLSACREGYIDTVKLLLENGANVNATNSHGYTVLMFAKHFKHDVIVKMLQMYMYTNTQNDKI